MSDPQEKERKMEKKKGVAASPRASRPKYRMLEDGEVKRKGDEFRDMMGDWMPIVFVGEKHDAELDEPVRRRIETPKASATKGSRPKASSPRNSKVTPNPQRRDAR